MNECNCVVEPADTVRINTDNKKEVKRMCFESVRMSVQHPGRQESVNKKKERASTGKRMVVVVSDGAHGEQKKAQGGEGIVTLFSRGTRGKL